MTTVSYVEKAKAVNFDRAEQDLLFPKKPWKTREEYQKAEEEFKMIQMKLERGEELYIV